MRQYRGKSLKTGKWHYGGLVGDGFSGWCICNVNMLGEIEKEKVDPKTVGQYIGSQDLSGKSVFEGDVIKSETGALYQVKYKNEYSKFCLCNSTVEMAGWSLSNVKVVGNIHDNPELMKG